MRVVVAGILALASVAVAAGARAQCETTTLATGITQDLCAQDGLQWAVVVADLTAADLDLRVTRPSERGSTADAWAGGLGGSVVAVQGGPFRFPDYEPSGFTIGDGEPWSAADDARLGVFAFDGRGGALVAEGPRIVLREAWMTAAVSGVPILRQGTLLTGCAPDGC